MDPLALVEEHAAPREEEELAASQTASFLEQHTFTPAIVGSGRSGLAFKFHRLLHQITLHVGAEASHCASNPGIRALHL